MFPASPASQADSLSLSPPGKPFSQKLFVQNLDRQPLPFVLLCRATHCSILAWEVPEEPGGLRSMESQELDMT